MFKRLIPALALLVGLLSPALAAGTIPYSLSQQLDEFGKPLGGCKLYLIQAGTVSTPQNGYQDSSLSLPLPNPLICDAAGRLPQFFLADGSIKVRLTKSSGVNVVTADGIVVIGASSGGGGGSPVDPTTILQTGAVQPYYGVGNRTGFVRLNGRTIGSSTSGASERANADTQSLFEYLWQADANLVVSTGRGVSANADWVANKTIALPDFRSRALAGLGDMGNSDNALFDGLTFTSGGSTTLGSLLGAAKNSIAQLNLPSVNFTVTIPAGQGSHTHGYNVFVPVSQYDPGNQPAAGGGVVGTSTGAATLPAMSGSAASGGSGTAMATVSPFGLVTLYVKL